MSIQSFPAIVTDIHDGDTFKVTVDLGVGTTAKDRDLGFHIYIENHRVVMHGDIRLLGCNARELAMPGGPEARDHLMQIMPIGTHVRISTTSPDKYGGRYDASVKLPDGNDLTVELVGEQWAATWTGVGTKPVPPWPRTVGG